MYADTSRVFRGLRCGRKTRDFGIAGDGRALATGRYPLPFGLLALFQSLTLAQAHTRAAAVLIDELNTGFFAIDPTKISDCWSSSTLPYLSAKAFAGDPTPPMRLSGFAETKHSQTLSVAQSAARSSRFHCSPMVNPSSAIMGACIIPAWRGCTSGTSFTSDAKGEFSTGGKHSRPKLSHAQTEN